MERHCSGSAIYADPTRARRRELAWLFGSTTTSVMAERTLIASATNLLWRGFQVVPVDRKSKAGAPVNGLYAVARALTRAISMKPPTRAVAVIDPTAKSSSSPDVLKQQLETLPVLCRALGLEVVESADELNLCASYAKAAVDAGDDVLIAAVDKRYAQLVRENVWWFDANKDLRYTEEIVEKRFGVPPPLVGEWLALVGDEDQVPGVKGVGAKGATEFLLEHGPMRDALARLEDLDGRVAKALKAAKDELPKKLEHATLNTTVALPRPIAELTWRPPVIATLNALYGSLGFSELLVADQHAQRSEVCETEAQLEAILEKWKGTLISFNALLDDPGIAGVGLARPDGETAYVPFTGKAWPRLVKWLEDSSAAKQGHDLVATMVNLRREGVTLAGVTGDSACASHLTQPSNWAPHDLTVTAKHVLGRALPDDEEVLGTGRARKTWSGLSIDRAAQIASFSKHAAEACARWPASRPNSTRTSSVSRAIRSTSTRPSSSVRCSSSS